ncbi:hypothetical protein B0I37DRAFT_405336, partial [Chaetomium sp. MPI-CAGE-AT-0009]
METSAAMETRKEIGFFDLPGEIRNMIYKLLVVPGDILFVSCDKPFGTLKLVPDKKRGPWLALVRTNRLIHKEASSLLYSCNTFLMDRPIGGQPPSLSPFLNCIGPVNAANLSEISVGFLDVATMKDPAEEAVAFEELRALRRCTGLKT